MAEVQKICVGCSMDVSQSKRVKDTKGRYYCAECAAALKGRLVARAQPPSSEPVVEKPDPEIVPLADGEMDLGEVRSPGHFAPESKPHRAPSRAASDDHGEIDLGEVRHPGRHLPAAQSRAPHSRSAPEGASGELELGEIRRPPGAPDPSSDAMFACASCKKIVPETEIRNDDGEFLCLPCFSKRHHAAPKAHGKPASKPKSLLGFLKSREKQK